MTQEPTLTKGVKLVCIAHHPNAEFTIGRIYKVNAIRQPSWMVVRDNKRRREDFNLWPTSKGYLFKYFKLL